MAGTVVLIFQPAEEGPGGALPMIEEGALDDPQVDAIAMLHVDSRLDVGTIGITPGGVNASADELYITVRGIGGHGAYPHTAVDAIPAAAAMVLALQNVVARETDPLASAVVTIGTIAGGYRNNVIADEIEMSGTLRAHDPAVRDALEERVRRIVAGVAAAYGVQRRSARRARVSAGRSTTRSWQESSPSMRASNGDARRRAAADDGRRRFRVFRAARSGVVDSSRRSQRIVGRRHPAHSPLFRHRRGGAAGRRRYAAFSFARHSRSGEIGS